MITQRLKNILIWGVISIIFVAGFAPIVFAGVYNPTDTSNLTGFLRDDADDTTTGNLTALTFIASGTAGNATSTFAGDINFGDTTSGLFYDSVNDRLSIGGTDNTLTINGTVKGSLLYTESQGGGNAYDVIFERHSNTASSVLTGVRSRGSHDSPTIVQDGDNIFEIKGAGYDGTDWETLAEIHFEVDGTPGYNDMPGVLRFLTTPDGSVTPLERLRIDSAGNVGIGTTSPLKKLHIDGGAAIVDEFATSSIASIDIDWDEGNQQLITMTQATTIASFSNVDVGQTLRLILCSDGTGRAITWSVAEILWSGGTEPTETATTNKCDLFTFVSTTATGTPKVFGGFVLNF